MERMEDPRRYLYAIDHAYMKLNEIVDWINREGDATRCRVECTPEINGKKNPRESNGLENKIMAQVGNLAVGACVTKIAKDHMLEVFDNQCQDDSRPNLIREALEQA